MRTKKDLDQFAVYIIQRYIYIIDAIYIYISQNIIYVNVPIAHYHESHIHVLVCPSRPTQSRRPRTAAGSETRRPSYKNTQLIN